MGAKLRCFTSLLGPALSPEQLVVLAVIFLILLLFLSFSLTEDGQKTVFDGDLYLLFLHTRQFCFDDIFLVIFGDIDAWYPSRERKLFAFNRAKANESTAPFRTSSRVTQSGARGVKPNYTTRTGQVVWLRILAASLPKIQRDQPCR